MRSVPVFVLCCVLACGCGDSGASTDAGSDSGSAADTSPPADGAAASDVAGTDGPGTDVVGTDTAGTETGPDTSGDPGTESDSTVGTDSAVPVEDVEQAEEVAPAVEIPDDPTPGPTCPTQTEVPPITDFTEIEVNGTRVRWLGEDTGVGVLFLIHGTGGDVTTWTDRVAGPEIIRDALDRGLVVVNLESLDRSDGAQWVISGPPAQNADIANVKAIMAQLEDDGVYSPTAPKFAVGGSNGGAFTSHLAQEVDLEGIVIFIARGSAFLSPQATTPPKVVFIPGVNDYEDAEEEIGIYFDIPEFVTLVGELGGEAYKWDNVPTPVTLDVLSRLPAVSCPQSYTITEGMQSAGLIDSDWMVVAEPTLASLDPLPPAFEDAKRVILDQLVESYGGHMVTAEFNEQWLDLFLEE